MLADDPMLNYRGMVSDGGTIRQPVRIVCDSRLRIPEESKLVKTAGELRTVVAYSSELCDNAQKAKSLADAGVELIDVALDPATGSIDLAKLLDTLGSMKIDGILLEGGGGLADSFARAGLIDEVRAFIAPKLIGGEKAKTPVEGEGVARLADALKMRLDKAERIGEDIMLTYFV